jgi:hypothetical protein
MPAVAFTPTDLFTSLAERSFDDYGTFERAFVESFNAHRFDLPAGYGWRDALAWGIDRRLVEREGQRIVVRLRASD